MSRIRVAVSLSLAVVLVAACGGDGTGAEESTTTSEQVAEDVTTTSAAPTETTEAEDGEGEPVDSSDISCESNQYEGRLGDVCSRGELRVGYGLYAPTAILEPGGTVKGVDIDVTRLFADALGVDVVYSEGSFGLLPAGVQARRYDMATSLVVTEERGEAIDFSDTLYTVGQLFAVRVDTPFQTLEDLNDPEFDIATSEGSFGHTVIQTYIPNATVQIVDFESNVQQLAHVLAGRSDGMPIETPFTTARVEAAYGDQFRFIPDPDSEEVLESDAVSYGLPKGDTEFVETFNLFLSSLHEEGVIEALFAVYVEETLEPIVVPEG